MHTYPDSQSQRSWLQCNNRMIEYGSPNVDCKGLTFRSLHIKFEAHHPSLQHHGEFPESLPDEQMIQGLPSSSFPEGQRQHHLLGYCDELGEPNRRVHGITLGATGRCQGNYDRILDSPVQYPLQTEHSGAHTQ